MANIYFGLFCLIYGIIAILFSGPITRFQIKLQSMIFGDVYNFEFEQFICVVSGIIGILAAIVIFMEVWGIWAIIGGTN